MSAFESVAVESLLSHLAMDRGSGVECVLRLLDDDIPNEMPIVGFKDDRGRREVVGRGRGGGGTDRVSDFVLAPPVRTHRQSLPAWHFSSKFSQPA